MTERVEDEFDQMTHEYDVMKQKESVGIYN